MFYLLFSVSLHHSTSVTIQNGHVFVLYVFVRFLAISEVLPDKLMVQCQDFFIDNRLISRSNEYQCRMIRFAGL